LEDGVGRGVADGLPRSDMLGAELVDDLRPRGVPVAEDAGKARLGDELLDELGGKARMLGREIAPDEGHPPAGELPVPARRVLAAARLDRVAEGRLGRELREAAGTPPGARRRRLAEAEPREVRQREIDALGDMAERVGALVAEARGVLRRADAEGVE